MTKYYITPNDTIGNNDSDSIQSAVDLAKAEGIHKVIIPRKNNRTNTFSWIITKTIRLPSDMQIILDNCFMQMADDVVGGFFCSDNLFTERGTRLEDRMHDIHIKGEGNAVLDGGKPTVLNEETQQDLGIPVRLNTPIFFMNVEGFSVENIKILHQRYWGMRFQFCARGIVRNIFFDICRDRRNQDGINLRNGCHDILIENISGQTGDDMIALSAIDSNTVPGSIFEKYDLIVKNHAWDIHDVTIRNISGAAIAHPLIAMRNHNGAKLYNIHIENIRDTEQTQAAFGDEVDRYSLVTLGVNLYYKKPSVMGDTYNITIKDLYCKFSKCAIFTGSTIKNCRFSNIYASGVCKAVLSVQADNWGDDVYGVKMENVLLDGVFFDTDDKNTSLLDFSFMREGDYIRNLVVTNVSAETTKIFARIHKRCEQREIRKINVYMPQLETDVAIVEPKEHKRADKKTKPFAPTIKRRDL